MRKKQVVRNETTMTITVHVLKYRCVAVPLPIILVAEKGPSDKEQKLKLNSKLKQRQRQQIRNVSGSFGRNSKVLHCSLFSAYHRNVIAMLDNEVNWCGAQYLSSSVRLIHRPTVLDLMPFPLTKKANRATTRSSPSPPLLVDARSGRSLMRRDDRTEFSGRT